MPVKSNTVSCCLLLTAICFFLASPARCATDIPSTTTHLTGHVLSHTRNPVREANINVRTVNAAGEIRSTFDIHTDEKGEFHVARNLVDSRYTTFTVTKAGYAKTVAQAVPLIGLRFSQSKQALNFGELEPIVLLPPFKIKGRVLRNGQPVQKAAVTLSSKHASSDYIIEPAPEPVEIASSTLTDSQGNFELEGVTFESYLGFSSGELAVRQTEGGRPWVAGTVSNSWDIPYLKNKVERASTLTFDERYDYSRNEGVSTEMESPPITLDLHPVLRFTGIVLDSNERPIEHAGVDVQQTAFSNQETKEDGRFRFLFCPGNTRDDTHPVINLQIPFLAGEFNYGKQALMLGQDQEKRIVIPASVQLCLGLQLSRDILEPPAVSLETSWAKDDLTYTSYGGNVSFIDDIGSSSKLAYLHLNLPTGTSRVKIKPDYIEPRTLTAQSGVLDAEIVWRNANATRFLELERIDDNSIVVKTQTGSKATLIVGVAPKPEEVKKSTVVRRILRADGSPASNVPVWVSDNANGKTEFLKTITNEQGEVSIELPYSASSYPDRFIVIAAPGSAYQISKLKNPERSEGIDDFFAYAAERAKYQTIQLSREFSLKGRVVDDKGRSIKDVRVSTSSWIFDNQKNPFAPLTTTSDAAGRWQLPGLGSPKDYQQVFATKVIGGKLWTGDVSCAPPDFGAKDVVLRPTATLKGKVLDEQGKPVWGALICGIDRGAGSFYAYTYTQSDGSFTFTDVPATSLQGKLVLQASLEGIGAIQTEVQAAQGQNAAHLWRRNQDIVLRFARYRNVTGQVLEADTLQPPPITLSLSPKIAPVIKDGFQHTQESEWPFQMPWLFHYYPPVFTGAQGLFQLCASENTDQYILQEQKFTLGALTRFEDLEGLVSPYKNDLRVQKMPRGKLVLLAEKKPGWLFLPSLTMQGNSYSWPYLNKFGGLKIRLDTRDAAGHVSSREMPPEWFVPAKDWGETKEFRAVAVGRDDKEEIDMTGWTSMTASREKWQVTIPWNAKD